MQIGKVGLKRQERCPEKFDVLDLFDSIGRSRKFVIGDANDERAFAETISKSLSANRTPTMIYGRRVEAMFAYMAASLGKCRLIKKEDSGDLFAEENVEIPDYRLVLNNGKQMLLEVKNYYQNNSFKAFSLKASYIDGLVCYADLMMIDIYIAIYWSKWSLWTLVKPTDFKRNGTKAEIKLTTALERNQMVAIGDYTIGTTPPLEIRLFTDKQKPHRIDDNGMAEFVVGSVDLLCNGTLITAESEKRIALALMLYGNWNENSTAVPAPNAEKDIDYIEFSYTPLEHDYKQKFSTMDSLSTIISRQYIQLTTSDGKVERLTPNIAPGALGFVIPESYKGTALPLWRFHIEPKK